MKHLSNEINAMLRDPSRFAKLEPGLYTVRLKSAHLDTCGKLDLNFDMEDENVQFTQSIHPLADVQPELDAAKLAVLDHVEKLAVAIDHVVVSQELWEEMNEQIEAAREMPQIPEGFAAEPVEYAALHNEIAAAFTLLMNAAGLSYAERDRFRKAADVLNQAASKAGRCMVVTAPWMLKEGQELFTTVKTYSFPETPATPKPQYFSVPQPIPENVYWNTLLGMFVDEGNRTLEAPFHRTWYSRREEFPVK